MFTVGPNEAYVFTSCGKIVKIEREMGVHWYWPFLSEKKVVHLEIKTTSIRGSKVPDGRGNPLEVSAVITYVIKNPVEALYHIDDPE